jgi:DNA repair protein RecO (recombination protein O)
VTIAHDEAVCLRHREWSETSQTVLLFTRAHGLLRGIAKGSRRERAPFSGGFELLQAGQVGFIAKAERDLATLTEWDLANPFSGLRSCYEAAVSCMFAGELTAGLLAPGDPHPAAYDAFIHLLGEVADPAADRGNLPRALTRYLFMLIRDTGHAPDLPAGENSGRPVGVLHFDPEHATFAQASPTAAIDTDPFSQSGPRHAVWPIRAETVRLLGLLATDPPAQPMPPPGDPAWTRAVRFLSAWAVYRSGRRPASLGAYLRTTRSEGPPASPGQAGPNSRRSLPG